MCRLIAKAVFTFVSRNVRVSGIAPRLSPIVYSAGAVIVFASILHLISTLMPFLEHFHGPMRKAALGNLIWLSMVVLRVASDPNNAQYVKQPSLFLETSIVSHCRILPRLRTAWNGCQIL